MLLEKLGKDVGKGIEYIKLIFEGNLLLPETIIQDAGIKDGSIALAMLRKTPEQLAEEKKQYDEEHEKRPVPTMPKDLYKQLDNLYQERLKSEKM